jgi:hypothetical protein
MNRRQKLVLAFGTILVIIAGLFPPWNFVAAIPRSGNEVKRSAGYGLLFSPPLIQSVDGKELNTGWPPGWIGVEINLPALFAEWITVVLATGGLFLLFRRLHIPESRWSLTPASQSKKPN